MNKLDTNKIDNTLFWDVDIKKLSCSTNYFFIIKRIILKGDKKDRDYMLSVFSPEQINEVLEYAKEIPPHLKSVYKKAIGKHEGG